MTGKQSGYSIIELMVAIAVFLVVSSVTVGSFVKMVDANYRVQSLRSTLDNLSIVIEDMSRSIREGVKYHCDYTNTTPLLTEARDCAAGETSFAYEAIDGDTYIYKLVSVAGNGAIQRSLDGGASWATTTSPHVNITNFTFFVEAEPAFPFDDQPRVVIVISGESGKQIKRRSSFSIQTTVTQRSPEV